MSKYFQIGTFLCSLNWNLPFLFKVNTLIQFNLTKFVSANLDSPVRGLRCKKTTKCTIILLNFPGACPFVHLRLIWPQLSLYPVYMQKWIILNKYKFKWILYICGPHIEPSLLKSWICPCSCQIIDLIALYIIILTGKEHYVPSHFPIVY